MVVVVCCVVVSLIVGEFAVVGVVSVVGLIGAGLVGFGGFLAAVGETVGGWMSAGLFGVLDRSSEFSSVLIVLDSPVLLMGKVLLAGSWSASIEAFEVRVAVKEGTSGLK